MTYSSLLTHSCYIQTKASSQNSLGEWTYSWTDSSSTTDCRMSPVNAKERTELPGRFDDIVFKGFFEVDSGVTVDTRIKYEDELYHVREAYSDSSGHHISTLLERL